MKLVIEVCLLMLGANGRSTWVKLGHSRATEVSDEVIATQ